MQSPCAQSITAPSPRSPAIPLPPSPAPSPASTISRLMPFIRLSVSRDCHCLDSELELESEPELASELGRLESELEVGEEFEASCVVWEGGSVGLGVRACDASVGANGDSEVNCSGRHVILGGGGMVFRWGWVVGV
ncbi:hypothetical protein KC19_3G222200 [Ceratodon purpureus]|uniref:Uncharacterized protein n=1 Tax=Ceratodon purpureus TaxID=3225 RepID=A0A8T0ILG4_CERPU|nr:hypothetical protein KC19_3G222200 [Ceratodon purpureus]